MQKAFALLRQVALLFTVAAAAVATAAQPADQMSVTRSPFGATRSGEPVELYTLQNGNGLKAQVMTYGAIIYSFEVPDKNG